MEFGHSDSVRLGVALRTGVEGARGERASGPERGTVASDTAAVAGVGLGGQPSPWPTAVWAQPVRTFRGPGRSHWESWSASRSALRLRREACPKGMRAPGRAAALCPPCSGPQTR